MRGPPEFKKFRVAVTVTYIAVTGFIFACLFVAGYRGAGARMGRAPAPAPIAAVDAAAQRTCAADLEALYRELNGKVGSIVDSWPARRSGLEWEEWSPGWRARVLAAGARCRLAQGDVPATAALREAYQRLLVLHRNYTTLSVQFSTEIGPSADKVRQAMEQARKSAGLEGAEPR